MTYLEFMLLGEDLTLALSSHLSPRLQSPGLQSGLQGAGDEKQVLLKEV